MNRTIDAGLVPLSEAEQLEIHGGGWSATLLAWLGAAVTAGFEAGQWVACALECVFSDR